MGYKELHDTILTDQELITGIAISTTRKTLDPGEVHDLNVIHLATDH